MPFGKDTNENIGGMLNVFENVISVIFPVFGGLLLFVSYKLLSGPKTEIAQKLGHSAWKIGAVLIGIVVLLKLIKFMRKRNSHE